MSPTEQCGAEREVLDKIRVCVLDPGYMSTHRDAEDVTWLADDEITPTVRP